MSKIDVNPWKQFCIGELFEVCTTKSLDKLLLDMNDSYEYPYIGRTGSDNGVQGYVQQQSFKPNDGHTFSVVQIGERVCQYRECEWYASQNMFLLKPLYDDVEMTALFMTTIITNALKQKFSGSAYSEYPTKISLTEMIISLPATPSGEPDWDYMENYMKAVMEREEVFAEHLASLTAEAVADGHPIDVSAWGEFRVGDLFEKLTLKYKGDHPFQKALDLSTAMTDEFNLPLVNAKLGDNGVMYYGRESDWESAEMTLDIVEDGAASVGTVYAQPQLTGVLYNAYLIKPKVGMTANCLLFVSTIMERCIKQHFSYSNKCTWAKVKMMLISLPVTPSGEPDWAYMEQFMQQQMDKSQQLVEHLDQIWNS